MERLQRENSRVKRQLEVAQRTSSALEEEVKEMAAALEAVSVENEQLHLRQQQRLQKQRQPPPQQEEEEEEEDDDDDDERQEGQEGQQKQQDEAEVQSDHGEAHTSS